MTTNVRSNDLFNSAFNNTLINKPDICQDNLNVRNVTPLSQSLFKTYTAYTGAIEHLSPILAEQSTFSNERGSLCVDMMIFTLRNEVLSPSRNVMLTSLWYAVLNVTGISTQEQ